MKKLQQFYILKFSSSRLKKENYNIKITLDEARMNNEVISITNSQLIRRHFILKGINFSQQELEELQAELKKLKRQKNSPSNKFQIETLKTKIDNILFLEDFISIEFDNKTHYLQVLKRKGFYINGIRFTPFMASAGMIRKNTALFMNNNYKHTLMDILENGRNESAEIVPAKLGAYFSLYSSSTLPVSFPKILVVPDKELATKQMVNFVTYQGVDTDDKIETIEKEVKTNAWDGQGLISPGLAQQWSEEMEMDYVFSGAVIRAPFLKGLVTVFDFHQFAREIAHTEYVTDIYGEIKSINDVELIISESMFKLWNAYQSTTDYVNKCHENKLGFGVSLTNPEVEKSYSRTSYQFLQILDLSDSDIANLCEPSVNWFRDISGETPEKMLLYATGEKGLTPEKFQQMESPIKALLINPQLSNDRYIQKRFISSINKRKKESYMGSILINANYQFMIGDPYYQCAHIFNIMDKIEPLLLNKQHYSHYWMEKGISKVGAIRSPIVHHSEFNVLNFKNTEETKKWFRHIKSGIIFPTNGVGLDCAIHGGADFDGDLVCTINNPIMSAGQIPGLPIMYESAKSPKQPTDLHNDTEQVHSQLNGYNSKVGFATNISSALYTMLANFDKGSQEYETIQNRLIIGRVIQGEIIDSVKGLEVPPFRNHWTKWKRITKDMTPEEKKYWKENNEVVCQVRPAYFRFLYPHYMKKYQEEVARYDTYAKLTFGKSIEEISKQQRKSQEERKLLNDFERFSFFLDNNSVVNLISRYMRTTVTLVNRYSAKNSRHADYQELLKNDFVPNAFLLKQMEEMLEEYKLFKKGLWKNPEDYFDNLSQFLEYLRKKCFVHISSNESELASYAVLATYKNQVTYVDFAWKMFGDGIVLNLLEKSNGSFHFPVEDENGEIEYLWNKYTMKEFSLEELNEN